MSSALPFITSATLPRTEGASLSSPALRTSSGTRPRLTMKPRAASAVMPEPLPDATRLMIASSSFASFCLGP